jgi:hypothetical protein
MELDNTFWSSADDYVFRGYYKYLRPSSGENGYIFRSERSDLTFIFPNELNKFLQEVTDPDEKGMVALMFLAVEEDPGTYRPVF